MLLILFIFCGALLPTPSFRQYFYAIVPFSILAIMYQINKVTQEESKSIYKGWAFALVVVATFISGIYGLYDFPESLNPDINRLIRH